MKRLYLIKWPELFQGEKYLEKDDNYFEGWYFKNTTNRNSIAFIPGISINKQDKKAFIQIITNNKSYYVDYDIDDFKFSHEPFYVKIGDNYFSKDKVHIDIKDDKQKLKVYGNIKYSCGNNIKSNIMGPFSYVPSMECNHAIISMKTRADGLIKINNSKMKFKDGISYIEKDWGCSFPKAYIWCQGNNFKNARVSFMLSIADIPFKLFNFRGLICALMIDDKEYRFATYNNAKIVKYDIENNSLNIVLKRGNYYLYIDSKYNDGLKLVAPVKGKMEKDILESISEIVTITLKKDNEIIFSDTSINCGLEIVK